MRVEVSRNLSLNKSKDRSKSPDVQKSPAGFDIGSKSPKKKDHNNIIRAKELELLKVNRQVTVYKKEIEALRNKVNQISGVERL